MNMQTETNNNSMKHDVEQLLAAGGLLRIEERSAEGMTFHLLRSAAVAEDEILCDYSLFDDQPVPGIMLDVSGAILIPDMDLSGLCWPKVLTAAQILIYDVDVSEADPTIRDWIAYVLGEERCQNAAPLQTERFLRTEPKSISEKVRSRLWIRTEAAKAGVSMQAIEAALEYDKGFYSGNTLESLYCWRKNDGLKLRNDVSALLDGIGKGLSAEKSRHCEILTAGYIARVACRIEDCSGKTAVSAEFFDETLLHVNDPFFIAAWHLADGIVSAAASDEDMEEALVDTLTAFGNRELRQEAFGF